MANTPPDEAPRRTVNEYGVIEYWDGQGRRHNPDGPSVIYPDRETYEQITGRDPTQVPESWFSNKYWRMHGVLHRLDGPAIEYWDGREEYWVDGKEVNELAWMWMGGETKEIPVSDNQA